MSYREMTMIEIREVLRRWQAGQGLRQIARETGVDRKTVRRYVHWAEGCDLGPDDPLTDEVVHLVGQGVQARPVTSPSEPRQALAPHRERIKSWLEGDSKTRPLRLTKVHTLLARRGVSITYATLRRFAIDELDWRQRAPTVRIDDPDPGHEAQIDFGHMGYLYDPETDRRRKLWALIITLSYSRYQFVWPTFLQTTEAICEGLDEAWIFFDGVPLRIVPDNPKPMVDKADPTDARLNPAFSDYAQDRGFYVDTARVRRPKDKPRVENQVPYVRESWFDGEVFEDLNAARRSAAQWCLEVAGTRIHGTTCEVPREVYEQREKPHMQSAPTTPFDVPHWADAKVHPDHHIQVLKSLYSLPTRYIGRTVRVRADRQIVRIYLRTELIKTHPRKAPGKRSTDPHDYPPGKSEYALRSIKGLRDRAAKRGEHVGYLAEQLLDRPLPWTAMRQGYQLLELCDRFGSERVDAVCKRALDFEVLDVPRIGRMLKAAQRFEHDAEQQGKLTQLPLSPRFARVAESFGTRGPGKEDPR